MKGSQKRWQSNSTDSVIGMLMGFDEPPPQRLVPDKSRVLSESYLHKVASISLRPGSSVPIGRSCRTDNDLVDGVKGVSRVRKVLDKCVNSSSSNARSSVRSSEPEHYAGRRVLRRHQKLEHDFASNSLNFALDMKDKPLPFSSNVSGFKHSRPEYRELGKSHHEFSWKELVVKGNVSGHSCVACTRSMRRISPPERHRSKFEDVLKAECKGYGHDPHLDQSSFDRRKAVKKVDRFGVSEMPRNLDIRLCTNGSLMEQLHKSTQGERRGRGPSLVDSPVRQGRHQDRAHRGSSREDSGEVDDQFQIWDNPLFAGSGEVDDQFHIWDKSLIK